MQLKARALRGLESQVSGFISIGSSPDMVRRGVMYPGIDSLV